MTRLSRLIIAGGFLLIASCLVAEEPFPPLYLEKTLFQGAMRREQAPAAEQRITGLILPHHLLVPRLIARGLRSCLGQQYDRIVILTPDHFWRSRQPVSVTKRDFQTCLGLVKTDRGAVDRLLKNPQVGESSLFSHEHGIHAILPFLNGYFPGVPVVPVVLQPTGNKAVWEGLADVLKPVVSSMTLVIQSTDFSHYLSSEEARRCDQETLRVIALGDPAGVFSLRQPAHVDSLASLYLQMRMQKDCFGSTPDVVANQNSVEFVPAETPPETMSKTTSYMVVLYKSSAPRAEPDMDFCFLGDTFFGRYAEKVLGRRQAKTLSLLASARGAGRCILNLEGVLIPDLIASPPADAPTPTSRPLTLLMDSELTLKCLKTLKVEAVSLANNHVHDWGQEAYHQTRTRVAAAGIKPLEHGSVTDFGPFRLVVLSDIDNAKRLFDGNISNEDLQALDGAPRDKPLFAFLHWGREWSCVPGKRENHLIDALRRRGVELLIGSHSHTGSVLAGDRAFLEVYSLGNFFFDQLRQGAEGLALDLRFFPQGTYFPRLRPLGNLYRRSQEP